MRTSALFETALVLCTLARGTVVPRNNDATAENGTATDIGTSKAYRILTAANENLVVLRFEPDVEPPALVEEIRLDGVIRKGAAPWVSRHPENRSKWRNQERRG